MVQTTFLWRVCRRYALGSVAALLIPCGMPTAFAAKADYSGFIENTSNYRESRGLTKLRNTAQLEFAKPLASQGRFTNISINGVVRGTYDAVYTVKDQVFGDRAGGAIGLQNSGAWVTGGIAPAIPPLGIVGGGGVPPFGATSPWGGGLPLPFSAITGAPNGASAFGTGAATLVAGQQQANPNSGLIVLGQHYTDPNGGVTIGVPVQPCDDDSRGCLGGYLADDEEELISPEFNDRWDFVRELYVDADLSLSNGNLWSFRVGKQQIVWGRTDLFRVLDVINPIDYSRNTIYDEFEDTRIPLWSLQAEYRMGATGVFDDLNFSLVWVFDKFRPAKLGQGGTPYQALGAGDLFRALGNCWDNGCTVSNFFPAGVGAGLPPNIVGTGSPALAGLAATDFGPGVIGIRDVNLPSWSLANTQWGVKFEGLYKAVGWSVNYLYTRQQLPSLHGGADGPPIAFDPFNGAAIGAPVPHLIAFDVEFPRINIVGGSLDFYVDSIKSVFRVEAAWSTGEEFADTSDPGLHSESDVVRWVIGWDRPTFIRWLNPHRSFLISGQVFGQHLLNHNEDTVTGPNGTFETGFADWKDNYIATLLIQGNYMNDRLTPQIILARDFRSHSGAVSPQVTWLINDHWKITGGFNYKVGRNGGRHRYDDNRAAIATQGLADTANAAFGVPLAAVAGSDGSLRGHFPLGIFRAGIFGTQIEEDELFFNIRYRF